MRATAVAVAVLTGAFAVSGCGGSRPSPATQYTTTPPTTNAGVSLESSRARQIALARASNRPRLFSIFPAVPGRKRCAIPEGGVHLKPATLPGVCTTTIRAARTHEPALIVTFTERWAWPPCPRGEYCAFEHRLHHTWQVIEGEPIGTASARLRVLATRERGATAPQDWK